MIVITNARIRTMTEEVFTGTLVMNEGKITAVGASVEIPEGVETIDAEGALLTPGLIDAHSHLGMWEENIGYEGDDGNELTDPLTPQLRAIDAINPRDDAFREALEGGVTMVMTGPGSANCMGGTFAVVRTLGHRIDDMIVRAPAAMKIAFGENPKRCYGKEGKAPRTRMMTAAMIRGILMRAKEYLAKKDAGKDVAFDDKLEALIPVLRREMPLKAHAHRADDIFTAIRIAKEFDLDLTLDHCTEGHLIVEDLMREPYPALVGPTFGNRPKVELTHKTFKTPGILAKAGMKVAIITDAPVIPERHLAMCAAFAVDSGMDEDEAWKSITKNPAEILGIDALVGTLEVGKSADVVLWKGDPMHEIDAKPAMVFVEGKCAVGGGKHEGSISGH